MNLVKFDPFRELEDMSARLNRLFGRPLAPGTAGDDGVFFADWTPAVDVQETDTEYLLKADLPDVKKEEVKVDVKDRILTVEGERKQEKEQQGKKFHRIERSYGKFVRRLALPAEVDDQKVAAEFKDGVLTVHLPKSPAAKPRAVEVKIM